MLGLWAGRGMLCVSKCLFTLLGCVCFPPASLFVVLCACLTDSVCESLDGSAAAGLANEQICGAWC